MIYTLFFLILFCIAALSAIFYRARWHYSENLMRNFSEQLTTLTHKFHKSNGQAEYYKKKFMDLQRQTHANLNNGEN